MIACLDLPAFPLQIAWRAEPSWRTHPVVVVDEDRPQGIVQWACERARHTGILVGQRYAHALSLCPGLRARVVPPEIVSRATDELRTALHALSPRVEPGEPGTFWLDGDGLERIFRDQTAWALAIDAVARERGYRGATVIGFSRFATFAIARATGSGITLSRSEPEERAAAAAVPLARLDIAPKLRDALARLGVGSVGQMVRLPGGGVLERFGREAHRLYQLAAGERWDPLVPTAPPEELDERELLDDDEANLDALAIVLANPTDRLLARLARRGRAATGLHVELVLRRAVGHTELRHEHVATAAPTLDRRALVRLVHLRLTSVPPSAPVHALRVWADHVAASREQLALFASRPRRDLHAADEALARLRAELGDDAIVRAVLRDGHLPEASFGWERVQRVIPATPVAHVVRPIVRRVRARPHALPPQPRQVRDDGWLLSGLEQGAVVRIVGPFVISGGWWAAGATGEVQREYHYAELRRGDCLWVYFDRGRRRWFEHGSLA